MRTMIPKKASLEDEAAAMMRQLDYFFLEYEVQPGEGWDNWSPRMTDDDRLEFETYRTRLIAALEAGAFGATTH